MKLSFLPTTSEEGKIYYKNFRQFDVIFISGDPHYDHPLSGTALLARLLDAKGYNVGVIAQPETDYDYQVCGKPRYFFCITSGLLDSMLANYTPLLKKRENILVPERALMVYTQKIKQLFKGTITVLGGVEATIRRFTHFDYKCNTLRRGILNDTKADILAFGSAERSLLTLLARMKSIMKEQNSDGKRKEGKEGNEGKPFEEIKQALNLPTIEGIAFRVKKRDIQKESNKARELPSYEDCVADKKKFNLLTRIQYLLPENVFIEQCGLGFIQHNRPAHTLTEKEMDVIYGLPFTRELHPSAKHIWQQQAMVERLKTSIVIGRGCWGSCSFCIIPLVQGKEVARRSRGSILKEIEALYANGEKKINDLTIPTLNMYGSRCSLYNEPQQMYSPILDEEITIFNKTTYCNQQCVGCNSRVLSDDLYPLLEEIEKLNQKHKGTELELRSAIRHDIILEQKKLFRKIMQFVTRLKIAPEHISDNVLKQMNKGTARAFTAFLEEYKKINTEQHTHKHLVPYFVAAHPGCTEKDMEELRDYCKKNGIYINLTQVFTPTPGTLSTAMYYTGENPMTREKVYVSRTFREKKNQKNILMAADETTFVDENG